MRTTLDLDDTVIRAARTLAAQREISGAAVSELALRGLRPSTSTSTTSTGFPVRSPISADHVITDELVATYQEDDA